MPVIAYHVVSSMYGFWLPNDPRGSNSSDVRADNLKPFGPATLVTTTRRSVANRPHDRALRFAAKKALVRPEVVLNGHQALSIAVGFGKQVERDHRVLMLVGKANGLTSVVDHLLDGPALGVLPDRAGADEGRDLDRDTDPLRDLDHRPDIPLEGARGAERLDAHPLVADFLGQPFHVSGGAWSRRRQPEIDRAEHALTCTASDRSDARERDSAPSCPDRQREA